MDSSLVIKVKYGDTLRRFNAPVKDNGLLDLDMNGMREKICGLFNFPIGADFNLTYVDEDGDVVTLVDDNDLSDVMRQDLKFLKITVKLNSDNKSARSHAESSCSSTPMRSPPVQNPLPTGFEHLLTAVPEQLRDKLSALSLDVTSKASSLHPVLGELVECVSKMGQPFLNCPAVNPVQSNAEIISPSSMPAPGRANQSDSKAGLFDILPKPPGLDLKEENVTRGGVAPASHTSVDLNAVPSHDTNPPRFIPMNMGPSLHGFRSGDDKKRTREQNDCNQSGNSVTLASTSRAAPLKPFFANECPFSGMSVANDSIVPPVVCPFNPSRRTLPQADSSSVVFHRGVQCDGCGAHPIIGPRYKSKVKHDYDLCDICFTEMGNEADYVKMDKPVTRRHLRPLPLIGGFPKSRIIRPPGQIPVPRAMRHCGVRSSGSKLDSRFIVDVNVLDGTVVAPSTAFTKIWRMRNSGTVAWPLGVRLMWTGGDKFSRSDSVELEIPQDGLPVGREIDVAVDFTSPELPGRYISYWKMSSSSGIKFGQRVWVLIQVDASLQDPQYENFQGLNLNLPPYCSGPRFSETVERVDSPVVGVGHVGADNSVSVSEPVNSVAVEQVNEQDLNFPINNSLLVGDGASAPHLPVTSSPISYPIIDLSVIPAPPTEEVPCIDVPASTDVGAKLNDDVESTLLKELEEMGFKQIDLNKEILRKNEYDLEQSVDDLCGVAEWDPILEELQEMGFCDKEMNKKLLQKNNGSIKRVVMDLLSGEKA